MIKCYMCEVLHKRKPRKAICVMPRYVEGNVDGFVEFIAVCAECAENWYDNVPSEDIIEGFWLNEFQHQAMANAMEGMENNEN